ncbi:hypothetical protein ES332_A12G308200v1 [Gossypium tomentosum]|uniref:Serine aminopeptidase S33 domain-containing protein n=1 Tax=Gossypium tomentosum TaxID=34277 RepID=A0A5D2N6X4_GOSTO|nr:hypothetical protein ES332_A12G308200v1 [Gossypium tomentosum]
MAVEPLTSGVSDLINALFSLRSLRSLLAVLNAVVLLLLLPTRRRKRTSALKSEAGKDEKHEGRKKGSVGTTKSTAFAVDLEAAARRSLAIRRVVQDDDGVSMREFSLYNHLHASNPIGTTCSARGDTLFIQIWTPISVKISDRYNDFAKRLNTNGFKVYGMDWIGHGGSDGLHGYVHSLDYAVNDMKMFLERVFVENLGLPCFCFDHSTGGAIVLKASLDPEVENRVAGIILTSPAVGVLAPIISFLLPRFQVHVANRRGNPVSRDPEALVAKYSDPLVYTGPLRVRTGYEILRITSYLQHNMKRLKVPFLVLHGMDDTVTDPKASQKLYDEASTDKTIKLYEGLLHDLLFEPEREAIMDDIIQWLNVRA